jgi:Ca2+/H+ antiporter
MPEPWRKLDLLVAALPIAVVADLRSAPAPLLFVVDVLAVVPLAGLIGRATESIAEEVGGTIGALLNATFGTFAELVIAALPVLEGEIEIVKASVVGSLVGNLLLLLGVSILFSSYDRTEIAFHRASHVQSTMLFLTVGIFLLPMLYSLRGESTLLRIDEISDVIAVVLIALYGLALLFTMRTHRSVFRGGAEARPRAEPGQCTAVLGGDGGDGRVPAAAAAPPAHRHRLGRRDRRLGRERSVPRWATARVSWPPPLGPPWRHAYGPQPAGTNRTAAPSSPYMI